MNMLFFLLFQLLKNEDIIKMASIFEEDWLVGCRSLLNKLFEPIEQEGMNWSGRSTNGYKHAAFINNPKTFFIFCKHNIFCIFYSLVFSINI